LTTIALVTLVLASSRSANAQLRVADVSAPGINCVFDPACTIVPTDTISAFVYPTAFFETGNGCVAISLPENKALLQTRTYVGSPGSSAAGLYVYEYRIDLVVTQAIPVAAMAIGFGPSVALDFDGDLGLDDVFLTVQGGLGSAVPTGIFQFKTSVIFEWFDPNQAASGFFFNSDSSIFMGLVSVLPPVSANAVLQLGQFGQPAGECPMTLSVPIRAPGRTPRLAIQQAIGLVHTIPLNDWIRANDHVHGAHRAALLRHLEHADALLDAGHSHAALELLMDVARKLDGDSPDWLMPGPAGSLDAVRLLYLNVATAVNLLAPESLPMAGPGP
jgi:hypothetical protein